MAFKDFLLLVVLSQLMMFDVEQFMSHSQRFSMISSSDEVDKVDVEVKSKFSHLTSTQPLRAPSSSCCFLNSLSKTVTFPEWRNFPVQFVIFLDFNRSAYSSQSLLRVSDI